MNWLMTIRQIRFRPVMMKWIMNITALPLKPEKGVNTKLILMYL